MLGFLCLMLIYPQVAGENKSGVLFYSLKAPGAMQYPDTCQKSPLNERQKEIIFKTKVSPIAFYRILLYK